MLHRWVVVLSLLAGMLSGCGQSSSETEQPQPTVKLPSLEMPVEERPTLPTPSPDPNLQSQPLPQQGND